MSKLTSAVIIRFHYAEDDPRFAWRYRYFMEEVLPHIKEQTYNDFDICVRCNHWHAHLFEQIGLKTFNVTDEYVKYRSLGGKQYFYDFVPWEYVQGLPKYDVQMGLDSDDIIEPDYVQGFMTEIEQHMVTAPGKSLHISYQPSTINIRDERRQIKLLNKYSPRKGSAFMALYQPDKSNYKFVYSMSHLTLWKLVDKSITLPCGHCMATIHGINESTGL